MIILSLKLGQRASPLDGSSSCSSRALSRLLPCTCHLEPGRHACMAVHCIYHAHNSGMVKCRKFHGRHGRARVGPVAFCFCHVCCHVVHDREHKNERIPAYHARGKSSRGHCHMRVVHRGHTRVPVV